MSFDLTGEIKLNKKNYQLYRRLQALFYAFCFFIFAYLIYLLLFPTQEFNFSFVSPNKGNVINPRDEKRNPITDGKFSAEQKINFDTSLSGNFSKIKLTFAPAKESRKPENSHISLRKSYHAFLYPEGQPIGFKNGTLIKKNGDLYLISSEKLRKFANPSIATTLGFNQDAFLTVSNNNDLQYSPTGEEITAIDNYPTDSLFKIEGLYYRLNDSGKLEKFVSAGAFHSQYDEILSIAKNTDFLNNYTLAENQIGFADGSLISYGLSVFIVSKNRIYPIGDPDIFLNQGYIWNDIIPISGDEFSFYQKEKIFTLASIHPDGTIFFTPDSKKWYIIDNEQKRELPSEIIARSWLKKKPIEILGTSLEILGSCDLTKGIFGNYSCFIPLNDREDTAGKYYEFRFVSNNELRIDNINLVYEKNITTQNLKLALRNMIIKIKARYGIQDSPQ